MSQIVNKQAQHVRNTDVVIYERAVWTVEYNGWTDDGLVRLHIRKAGSYFSKSVEVSCDVLIETLELN